MLNNTKTTCDCLKNPKGTSIVHNIQKAIEFHFSENVNTESLIPSHININFDLSYNSSKIRIRIKTINDVKNSYCPKDENETKIRIKTLNAIASSILIPILLLSYIIAIAAVTTIISNKNNKVIDVVKSIIPQANNPWAIFTIALMIAIISGVTESRLTRSTMFYAHTVAKQLVDTYPPLNIEDNPLRIVLSAVLALSQMIIPPLLVVESIQNMYDTKLILSEIE